MIMKGLCSLELMSKGLNRVLTASGLKFYLDEDFLPNCHLEYSDYNTSQIRNSVFFASEAVHLLIELRGGQCEHSSLSLTVHCGCLPSVSPAK